MENALTYGLRITAKAVCGACKHAGMGVADSKLKARHDLKDQGWKIVRHRGGSQTVRCPACQQNDKAAVAERKARLKALAKEKAAFLAKNREERNKALAMDATAEPTPESDAG